MNTIIKAILRFFKYSKLSFTGLFMLVFFSSTIYTTLNNTTTNLNKSYQKISDEGNLHDFVINENFKYGNGSYSLEIPKNPNDVNSQPIDGTVKISSITQKTKNSYNVTFELDTLKILDENSEFLWTDAYYKIYDEYSKEPNNYSLFKTFLSFESEILVKQTTTNTIDINNWYLDNDFINESFNIVEEKKIELQKYVTSEFKKIYIKDLKNTFDVDVRDFNSINITNTKQGIFFKMIESSTSNSIDKLVITDGNNLTNDIDHFEKFNKLETFNQEEKDKYFRELVEYLYKAKWSSGHSDHNNFIDLYNKVSSDSTYNPYTNKDINGIVSNSKIKKQSSIFKSIIDTNGVYSNGFSIKFSFLSSGVIPVIGVLEEYSSYEIVISNEYLSKLKKEPININLWNDHKKDSQESFELWFKSLPDKNKISIDNQEFIILGTGISPDFMYPVLSFENVVPNSDKEQLVYVNGFGYSKMLDAFRGNNQENFIVGKFVNVSAHNKKRIIEQINEFNTKYMAWPTNIPSTYFYDDISNTITPTALRMQFIPNTILAMKTVSIFLTTITVVLSIFISIVVIQRFIQINRNNLGIMQANGYKKWEITLGVCALISIPVGIASIIGYGIGVGVQQNVIDLLGNFWTLPTTIEPFSFIILLPLFLVAVVGFMLVTVIFSFWSLRGETSEFMKDDSKYKSTKLAEKIKKPFSKFSIMTRFRAAIAFSSIWRIVLLSIMSAGLMMSLTFSFNAIGAFDNSSKKTFEPRKYSYAIDLLTPTLQGGQFYAIPSQFQGITFDRNKYFNNSKEDFIGVDSYNDKWVSSKIENTNYYGKYLDNTKKEYNPIFYYFIKIFGNSQIVSQEDSNKQNTELFYLKNKTSYKPYINAELGVGSLSTNPWFLAEQLMPPNNANYVNQTYKDIFSKATELNNSNVNDKNNHLINLGIISKTSDASNEVVDGKTYERKTYYEYIKNFSKVYAVQKQYTNSKPSISGVAENSIVLITQEEANNNSLLFLNKTDSNEFYDYYFEFDNKKITQAILGIRMSFNVNFLCLLFWIYSNENLYDYAYGINYNKVVIDSNESRSDSAYSYLEFNIETINGDKKNISDNFVANGLLGNQNHPETRFEIKNIDNEEIAPKLWNYEIKIEENANVYPMIVNAYAEEKYSLNIGDKISVRVKNSTDRYSRLHFGIDYPIATFKIIDISTTYQGPEFYISQYDANEILGLTINNIKPKVPTSKEELKSKVSWDKVEYDWGNSYQLKTSQEVATINFDRNNFDPKRSGFNGIFSLSSSELKEVTSGMSLYSPTGIYPATDRIDTNTLIINKLLSSPDNMKKFIETLGFFDLVSKDSNGNFDWNATASSAKIKSIIDSVSAVFGNSSSFAIITNVESKDSTINVINTISSTATKIQNIVLSIIIIISITIVIIISSIIINDSIKLAAILKCLGLADRNNALSFLSVYFPVFILGLIISIPFSILLSILYVKVIMIYSGILLVIKPIWWHFVLSALGVIMVFGISYRVAWSNLTKMNLSESIK